MERPWRSFRSLGALVFKSVPVLFVGGRTFISFVFVIVFCIVIEEVNGTQSKRRPLPEVMKCSWTTPLHRPTKRHRTSTFTCRFHPVIAFAIAHVPIFSRTLLSAYDRAICLSSVCLKRCRTLSRDLNVLAIFLHRLIVCTKSLGKNSKAF